MDSSEKINSLLVEVFNLFLGLEEKALHKSGSADLSMKETHVLEAVIRGGEAGENTVGDVSRKLGVTIGSLSVAATTLVRKGYLSRSREGRDKRSVRLLATPAALAAEERHRGFHRGMTEALDKNLSAAELETLSRALSILSQFFKETPEA